MNKENNKGIFIFLITLLCFFSFLGFFLFKIYRDKKDAREFVDLEEKTEQNLSVDKNIYTLMSLTTGGVYEEGFSNASQKVIYDFEEKEDKKVSELKEEVIAFLVYQYATNHSELKKTKEKEVYLTETSAKKIYSTLFGDNFSYQRIEKADICPSVSFDKSKKRYLYKMDCGMSTEITFYSKIVNTKKKEGLLYIEELVGYYASALIDNNVFSTYKDAINKENSIGTIHESTEVQMKSLKDSLARYRYTFKEDEDHRYYFYSVKRIV